MRQLILSLGLVVILCGCGEQSSTAKTSAESLPTASAQVHPESGDDKIEQLKIKADGGDAKAIFQLSNRYRNGRGVVKNTALADSLLQKAADLNYPAALYRLAGQSEFFISFNSHLIDGKTGAEKLKNAEKYYSEAVRLYSKANDLGYSKAQEELAFTLLAGLDDVARANGVALAKVPTQFRGSIIRALPLFEQAAANERPRAMVAIYRIYNEKKWGWQNLTIAAASMARLRTVSDAKAIAEIGDHLYHGLLADKRGNDPVALDDFKPEREWVSESQPFIFRAAEAGVKDAQVLLSRIHLGGFNGYKDPKEAAKWLEKASIAGDIWAQVTLARLYMAGTGVFQDYSAAVKLLEQAATSKEYDRKVWEAQYLLGLLNENGLGVRKNLVKAHAWYNISATNQFDEAEARRKALTSQLSADQLSEAQELAKNWKPGSNSLAGTPLERSGATASSGLPLTKSGTGTLFLVSPTGMAITNQHVVNGCGELRVEGRNGLAKLVTEDKVNDLALVQIPGEAQGSAPITADPAKLRQGEDIVVFGFPLNAVLSSSGNLTPGVVSALTGLGNNTNQIQITAPIQPGSSGSPVLNKKGEVVGVVAMKLSDSKMAKATGQIGQNVNFAVNGQTLRTFLDTHKVVYQSGAGFFSMDKNTADLADEARKWTLVLACWN